MQHRLDRVEGRVDPDDVPRLPKRLCQRLRFLDLPADDRLDDLRELCRMSSRQKNPSPLCPTYPTYLTYLAHQPHVRDRGMGIEKVAARLEHLSDRFTNAIVREGHADHIVAHGVAIAAVQP